MAQYDFTIYASCSPQKIVEIPKGDRFLGLKQQYKEQ